jgi:hypothetical protein
MGRCRLTCAVGAWKTVDGVGAQHRLLSMGERSQQHRCVTEASNRSRRQKPDFCSRGHSMSKHVGAVGGDAMADEVEGRLVWAEDGGVGAREGRRRLQVVVGGRGAARRWWLL